MTKLPQRAATHRRHIHYVDKTLQKWLLVALVGLEVGLVAGMVWMLYWRLGQVIENNLFRVHLARDQSLFFDLMREAPLILSIFLVANVLALLLADGIWRRQVNSLLRSFMSLVGKSGRLDFSADAQPSGRHRLLDLAHRQRARERLRLAAIRETIAKLDAELSGAADSRNLRELLNGLNQLVGRAR